MNRLSVRTLVGCALLTALAVVLARLLSFAPTESTRYSLETLPILLAGLLFGPLAGALVGFASDFLGCLLSPWGYNPLLCLPPMLLGLWAGFWRITICHSERSEAESKNLEEKRELSDWLRIALALLPPIACGYILEQSAALALVYHPNTFMPSFAANLGARSIQYGVIAAIDLLLARLLYPLLKRQTSQGA